MIGIVDNIGMEWRFGNTTCEVFFRRGLCDTGARWFCFSPALFMKNFWGGFCFHQRGLTCYNELFLVPPARFYFVVSVGDLRELVEIFSSWGGFFRGRNRPSG